MLNLYRTKNGPGILAKSHKNADLVIVVHELSDAVGAFYESNEFLFLEEDANPAKKRRSFLYARQPKMGVEIVRDPETGDEIDRNYAPVELTPFTKVNM